jgi:uncharacterized membrane protein YvbJ
MKCPNCGYQNDEDAGYCEKCGTELLQICQVCGAPIKPGSSFCKKCGSPVTSVRQSNNISQLKSMQQAAPNEIKDKLKDISGTLEGQRKPVTILFTDIVGSTSLAENWILKNGKK